LSTIIDLGTLGGDHTDAYAINASAQVTGDSYLADRSEHAYFRDRSGMHDLGILPGGTFSVGNAINDSGQVAGFANINPDDPNNHAFRWDPATGLHDLGSLGGEDTVAWAMNSFGEVAGESALPTGNYAAFLFSNGTMDDIGSLGGGYARATGINDTDQVVGFSNLPGSFTQHAFLWDSVHGMRDLGTLGGDTSSANAINASGQVVGFSSPTGSSQEHAFLWDSVHGMQDLGTLPGYEESYARAVSDRGQVVGESLYQNGRIFFCHAFLYGHGTMTDLNDLLPPGSGWTLSSAYAINNAGQVVGTGTTADGHLHAYLLTLNHKPTDLQAVLGGPLVAQQIGFQPQLAPPGLESPLPGSDRRADSVQQVPGELPLRQGIDPNAANLPASCCAARRTQDADFQRLVDLAADGLAMDHVEQGF
jgi:probable HAF family extracellular repeat protein